MVREGTPAFTEFSAQVLGCASGLVRTALLGREPQVEAAIGPGMAFHTPINLFEHGRFGVGCSETWLVTPNGREALSGQSRELHLL